MKLELNGERKKTTFIPAASQMNGILKEYQLT